jgi:hydroxyacylglutathione hydrolase
VAALEYQDKVTRLRELDEPTLPSTLALEIQVNPFLRCEQPIVVNAAEEHVGYTLDSAALVFGVLRAWKDQFR